MLNKAVIQKRGSLIRNAVKYNDWSGYEKKDSDCF